nr:heterogeneous nuclear ribonucleoprotein 1-like [Ipomoea batatas]
MEMEHGKLFVGGISWDTTEERLRAYFQTFGEVVEAVIMKDRTTGRARGFGFVVFADPSVAERVVKEKHMIDGRTVEAKKAVPREDQHTNRNNGIIQSPQNSIRTKKIFVGGLASSVTESDFKQYFDQFGTITDVVVMYDHNTQRPRGFGFITYDSEEAVDKVLHKTFHELNGKMVEVKRAVPKELSPGPTRSPLAGYNYGLNRVSNFLNAYSQGYNLGSMGSYGVRMDRFSPTTLGRTGYSSLNASNYNIGPTLDPALSSNYGGSGSFSSNVGFGHDLNSFYSGNSNRYISPMGYALGRVGSGSMLTSAGRGMLDNESAHFSTNTTNASDFVGSVGGNTGLSAALGGLGTIWGSSPISGQGGRNGSSASGNINYNNGAGSFAGVGGYGQNSVNSPAATSLFPARKDVHTGDFGNLYGTGSSSLSEDPTWRSLSPELDHSTSFSYGLGSMPSDVITNNSLGYVGSL